MIEESVPASVVCDCCKAEYPVCTYDRYSLFGAGFAVVTGTDPAGFGEYNYKEHACSLDCTFALIRKHLAPTVAFPSTWASQKNNV